MNKRALLVFSLLASNLAMPGGNACASGDVSHGSSVFAEQCAVCHSALPGRNKIGPSLFGVLGRKAGSMESYAYSDALKNSGVQWTEEMLEAYIAAPEKVIPGVKMTYSGLTDARSREDVAAYLMTLHP